MGLPSGRSWKMPAIQESRSQGKQDGVRREQRTVLVRLAVLFTACALVEVLVAPLRADIPFRRVLLAHDLW